MQDFYSNFFNSNETHKYNNILFSKKEDFIQITRVGLHNIYRKKIVKESHFHSHSFHEFHFSLNGYAVYQFADHSSVKLEKGSWILIPTNLPHKIIEYSERYIKYSCAFMLPEQQSQNIEMHYLNEVFQQQIPRNGMISESILESIQQIYEKLPDPHPLQKESIHALSKSIVFSLAAQLSKEMFKENHEQKNDTRLSVAIEFIKDNIFNPITGEDVAKKVYLSLRQLDRIFLKYRSISVSEFIYEQKIEEAKKMLTSTALPVYEISDKLKFSSPAYFNRFFKKRVGKPPYKFRSDTRKGE